METTNITENNYFKIKEYNTHEPFQDLSYCTDPFKSPEIFNQEPIYKVSNGYVDPGGDPIGNPVPISDGLFIMSFFIIIYTIKKFLKLKHEKNY